MLNEKVILARTSGMLVSKKAHNSNGYPYHHRLESVLSVAAPVADTTRIREKTKRREYRLEAVLTFASNMKGVSMRA